MILEIVWATLGIASTMALGATAVREIEEEGGNYKKAVMCLVACVFTYLWAIYLTYEFVALPIGKVTSSTLPDKGSGIHMFTTIAVWGGVLLAGLFATVYGGSMLRIQMANLRKNPSAAKHS